METALTALGAQSGLTIIVETKVSRGVKAAALTGTYTTDEALKKLLEPAGLRAEYLDTKTVAIRSVAEQTVTTTTGMRQSSLRIAQNTGDTGNTGEENKGTEGDSNTGSETAQNKNDESSKASTEAKESLNEIVVTGSRIRASQNGASPIHTFDRRDFAQVGATSVQQIMRQLPQNFQGGASDTGGTMAMGRNGAESNIAFGSGVNLRGLGNASTLTLLNGRRLPPGGLGGVVDISLIPLNALQRIDVVTDGASAIYGADAVGGVVNFVLRDNFKGIETSLRQGATTSGNLREFDASLLAGTTWDGGAALVNFSYNERDPLLASERDFASPFSQGGSTFLSPDDRARSVLVHGHRDFTDAVKLTATLFGTRREAHVETFRAAIFSLPATQHTNDAVTDQFGGTLALDWQLTNDWMLGFAQTNSRSETDRDNLSVPPPVGNGRSSVLADHKLSASEVKAEGPIFSMPGGSARLALGAEHRSESLDYDRINIAAGGHFTRDVDAGYMEAFLPILGASNSAAWAKRLELTAAVRFEDYSDVGSTTNSKFGVLWSPAEGVALRATRGTSFRAPYLYQYDSTLAVGFLFPSFDSPTDIVATVVQMPAPGLGPENATTLTAGLDLGPEILSGFKLGLTYFNIDYRDRINAAGLSFTPFSNQSLVPLISSPPDPVILAQLANIEATTPAQFLNLAFPLPISAATVTLDARTRNQAKSEVSGLDLSISRSFPIGGATLELGADATYLFEFENQALNNAPVIDIADTIFNSIDLKMRGRASLSNGGWELAAIVNYADEYKDTQLPVVIDIASWTTVDLCVGYSFEPGNAFTDGLTLRLNANNAFDADPPHINDLGIVPGGGYGDAGFDPENATPYGRVVSFQVLKRW